MKTKFVFCLVSWFCLLSIGVIRAGSDDFTSGTKIMLSYNDVPFQKPKGSDQEQRSIFVPILISAFLSNKQSIELEFYQAIGNIEIIISQNEILHLRILNLIFLKVFLFQKDYQDVVYLR